MLPKQSTWENLPKNSIDLAVADCYNLHVQQRCIQALGLMRITVKTLVPHSHESTLLAKLSYAKLKMAGLNFLFPVITCESRPNL